jgi:hypothetical protein
MSDIPTQPMMNGGKTAKERLAEMERDIEDLKKLVNEQEVTIATLKERLSVFSMAQAALTLIVGAVAAYIGRSG